MKQVREHLLSTSCLCTVLPGAIKGARQSCSVLLALVPVARLSQALWKCPTCAQLEENRFLSWFVLSYMHMAFPMCPDQSVPHCGHYCFLSVSVHLAL